MSTLSQPENLGLLMLLVGTVVGCLLLYRFVVWVRESPSTPDPWGPEIDNSLHESDAVVVCHRCFNPCPARGWFCEHCGGAVGPYNNYMPYVEVFSEGEVFRNGVTGKVRPRPVIIAGYFLYSLTSYLIFAPVYWFFLVRHLKHQRSEDPAIEPREQRQS